MTDDIPTLRRRLQKIEALHKSGDLGPDAYTQARREVERALVDAVMRGAPDGPTAADAVGDGATAARPSGWLVGGLAVAVLVLAGVGYAWTGSPGLQPRVAAAAAEGGAAGGGPSEAETAQIAAMVDKLAAHLKEKPEDAQGWAMLARSYAVLGKAAEALPAYKQALALKPDDARLLADYADALAVQNGRNLAGEPTKLVERALQIDPTNVKALALAGTAAFDRKDYALAVQHWEKLLQVGPTDAAFVQQVQAGITEARTLGKLPPAATAFSATAPNATAANPATPPTAAAAAAAPTTAPAAGDNPPAAPGAGSVSGTVSLAPALAAKASPEDTVFIFARAAQGPRMPLAILRKQVKDLPLEFKLDDSMAMSPAAKLSGAPQVIVGARVSKSGQAMPTPGDLAGQTAPVAPGATGLKIVIDEVVGTQ
jgi:cytochrome c-type biogenesis protein CcmH